MAFDKQANDLGFDDGLFGRPMMTREQWGREAGYGDYIDGYDQGEEVRLTGQDGPYVYRKKED